MWLFLSFLPLAFALSLDGFGAGVTYGMRKIRLPLTSTLIISGLSAVVFFTSMKFGGWITSGISSKLTTIIGASILIVLGGWALVQSAWLKKSQQHSEKNRDPMRMYRFELKHLGIIIEILKRPTAADMDQSGCISSTEALFLGLALSLDSLGAGMAAAMIGLSPYMCALIIGIMSGCFIQAGMFCGLRYSEKEWSQLFTYAPGALLVVIGLSRLF